MAVFPAHPWLIVIAAVLGLFIAILVVIEIGRRTGKRHFAKDPENAGKGLGPLEGAVFGLMGLLIAFTFSGAGERFEARRQLIVEETNAIGTAYLRLNLLPATAQPALRESFRRYLEARLEYYRNIPDNMPAAQQAAQLSTALQHQIWNQAVEAMSQVGPQANAAAVTTLVLQSLNDMIDITTKRLMALQTHPPAVVYWTLVVLVLASALLAGYETAARKARSLPHMVGFALILTTSIFVILDYEYPRIGTVRIASADQVLLDLRNSMK